MEPVEPRMAMCFKLLRSASCRFPARIGGTRETHTLFSVSLQNGPLEIVPDCRSRKDKCVDAV